jgi:hypothetical protein
VDAGAPDGLLMRMRQGEGAHVTNLAFALALLLIWISTVTFVSSARRVVAWICGAACEHAPPSQRVQAQSCGGASLAGVANYLADRSTFDLTGRNSTAVASQHFVARVDGPVVVRTAPGPRAQMRLRELQVMEQLLEPKRRQKQEPWQAWLKPRKSVDTISANTGRGTNGVGPLRMAVTDCGRQRRRRFDSPKSAMSRRC